MALSKFPFLLIPILFWPIFLLADPPIANPDTAQTQVNTPVTIAVLDNDLCFSSCTLASITNQPANGIAIVNTNGTITYAPYPGFIGADPFTYQVCDGNGDCATGEVSLTVSQQQCIGIVCPLYYRPVPQSKNVVIIGDYSIEVLNANYGVAVVRSGLTEVFPETPASEIFDFIYRGNVCPIEPASFEYMIYETNNPDETVYQVWTEFEGYIDCEGRTVNNPCPPFGATPVGLHDFGILTVRDRRVLRASKCGIPTFSSIQAIPANGTATLSPNGDLAYEPNSGYYGPDSISLVSGSDTYTLYIIVEAIVPTLSQWGLATLALLLLGFSLEYLFLLQPAGYRLPRRQPFSWFSFAKLFPFIMLALLLVVWLIWRQLTALDLVGTVVCGALLSYIVNRL